MDPATTATKAAESSSNNGWLASTWCQIHASISRSAVNAVWSHRVGYFTECLTWSVEQMALYNKAVPHEVKLIELVRADGQKHSAVRFTHPEYTSYSIWCCGLRAPWQEVIHWIWNVHRATRSNFIGVNYRDSTPEKVEVPTEEQLIQDLMHEVKELRKKGIPADKIRLYGTSFGGGLIPITVARLAREGIVLEFFVVERSFRNLGAASEYLVTGIGSLYKGYFAERKLMLEAEKALADLQGRMIVITHTGDLVIRPPAQFKTALDACTLPLQLKQIIHIDMKEDDTPWGGDKAFGGSYMRAHCRPLNTDELTRLALAVERILSKKDQPGENQCHISHV